MRAISLCLVLLAGCGPQPTALRLDFTWAGITVDQVRFQVTRNNAAVTDPLLRPNTPATLTSGAEVMILLPDTLAGTPVHVTGSVRLGGKDLDTADTDVTPVLHGETHVALAFGAVAPSLVVSPGSATLGLRDTQQLKAMLTDQSGNSDVSATAAWVSSAPLVASVAPGGLVTSHAVGQAKITAMASGLTAASNITVSFFPPAVTSVDCAPATVTVMKNQNQQLQATAHYQDGTTAPVTSTAVFTSSDRAVVDVNTSGMQGQVTGKKPGDAQVTATVAGFNGVCTVHVM